MLTVLLGALVSIGIAAFAISVILREFQARWPEVVAALAFDERAFVGGDVRPAASPRRLQTAPIPARHRSSRRVAA